MTRRGGDGAFLWPSGVSCFEDVSLEFLRAVEHANRVLDWQENLAGDEMPPEWMWPFDNELKPWFERIDEERRSKYGGEDDSDNGPVVHNEFADGMRG